MAALSSSHDPRLPAFLRQSSSDVHNSFVDLEWQQRERLLRGTQQADGDSEAPSEFARLTGDLVTSRNRYANVEPFAQNRIKLNVGEGQNDYINASPIRLGQRRYIATQGPKNTSVNHFYRMLAAEVTSPAVVVMLTQTHEAGREKCFQYYPLSAEESPMIIQPDGDAQDGFRGEVQLESIEDDAGSRSQVRKLRLRTSGGERDVELEIRHLLFSGWPDFLVPEGDDRVALIELVRLSAAFNSAPNKATQMNGGPSLAHDLADVNLHNPRIIHCSAGVGRSGTFIALDYLLSLLYAGELDAIEDGRDLIAETVNQLRQQRMMMVQGESQFHFLYDVLRGQMLARIEARDAQAS